MVHRQSGPQRRNPVSESALIERNGIQVTLHHHDSVGFANALFRLVEAVKSRAFAEERRLAGIEILRQPLVQDPAAETYDLAGRIDNGKHQAGKKFLVNLTGAALPDESETQRVRGRQLFPSQQFRQSGAGLGRVAEHKITRRVEIDPPGLQVIECSFPLGVIEQQSLVVGGRPFVDVIKRLAFAGFFRPAPALGPFDDDAVALGDALHGLGKSQMIVLHEKLKDAPARPTAEAMKDPLLFVYGKRGRFFRMKGAEPHVVAAGFFKREDIRDDLDDGCPVADFDNLILLDHDGKSKTRNRSPMFAPRRFAWETFFPCWRG